MRKLILLVLWVFGAINIYSQTFLDNLAGGTTGQIMVKGSNSTFDYGYISTLPIANGGTGQTSAANAFNAFAPSRVGNSLKYLRVNAGETGYELVTIAGGGDLLAANNLDDLVSAPTALTNLGGTDIGINIFILPNPNAITFPRFNANNSITPRTAEEFLADIGGQASGSYITSGGALGTPSSGTATNLTGLPLTTGVTGILSAANGGTGINNSTRTLTINSNSGTINFSAASKTLTVPLDASVAGTNTGDQSSIVGITGTTAQFNTALTDGDFATGGGTATGTNTGDQTTVSGNAGSATVLQTARNINGVPFNGSADVTVPAAAGTLTGTTLNSSVVSSSLTSVGTIGTGTWNATTIGVAKGGTGLTALGSSGQFLRTNLAGTLMEWTTLAGGGDLLAENNLSDVQDVPTSRTNLGLGNVTNESKATMFTNSALTGITTAVTGTFSGLVTFATGTTSLAAANIPTGTLKTTPAAGDLEKDANCLYGTTDAGNRGYIPVRHFIRCNATRTLPNDTNLNPIFNSPANGRLTLETGTYMFKAFIIITSMSGTSGNALFNILGAGTATAGAWLWYTAGLDNTTPATISADLSAYYTTNATAASVVTAGTGTALRLNFVGTFEVTVAGTLIPSIDLVTGAAGVVAIGSYFMCERIGSDAVVSVGQWD